jgi:HlyD family secretion protein
MKKKIPIVIVLSAIVASAGWFYVKHHRENEAGLTLYGNVDIREVTLGFRVSGKLEKLAYDEGDKVKSGAVLAMLDDEPYLNQVASVQAQVDSKRALLQLREAGNRPEEIAQAKALVRELEVTAANAELLLKRSEEMLLAKGVSIQDRDNAAASFKETEAKLSSARENLALLEAGFRVEDIAQARADLAQAEASLATAKLELKDTILNAPSDGVILTRAQEAGAILQTGSTVFTLSLVNPVWVRAYVHEPDLGHIHPGMKVNIYTDSRLGRPYRGQIGYISPSAEFTPKSVETTELRTALVYRLRVVVADPDDGLRQGMPVTITMVGN